MIFLGCLFNREESNEIMTKSKNGLSNAANTYQWQLIDGIIENNRKIKLKIVNILPVGTFPNKYKQLILKTKKWKYKKKECVEIGCINIPIFKQIIRYNKIKKLLENSDDKNILIYSTYLPFLKSVYKLDKSYNVTLIVTDLPEYYDLGKTNKLYQILRKINNKFIYKYLKRVDKYILLTEQMKIPLKIKEKPYIVVEGMTKIYEKNESKQNNDKIILYTGTLHKQFGILNLVNAFMQIQKDNYKLWICGAGDSEEELKKISIYDKRITFFGYLPKEEVNKLCLKSTILINPRKNEGEYTKYSFPSKTMEYLASGVPVLMYKLDGIPKEYDKYINYIKGNTTKDMRESIESLCDKSQKELHEIGLIGKEFVLKNKNNKSQAQKILNFINESENKNEK